jgi:WhiB family redox-sensing transcriptional regulator
MSVRLDLAWQADAACSGYPMNWWFPPRGVSSRRALEICEPCPVRADCLEWSMTMPVPHGMREFGIYGGALADVRRKLCLARCATCRAPVPVAKKVSQFLAGTPPAHLRCPGCHAHARAHEAALRVKREWRPEWLSR